MSQSAEWFVGLRLLRARRQSSFVSFISLASLAGVALGVAALIVIISVMNGFEAELRSRLLSMTAHGFVTGSEDSLSNWGDVREDLLEYPGITAAAPVVEAEGMIRTGSSLNSIILHGVLPAEEQTLSDVESRFVEGSLNELVAGERHILLGRFLAIDLGVRIDDAVMLLIPRPDGQGSVEPVLYRFTVRGVFDAGVQDHDATLALVHANDAADLLDLDERVTAVRFVSHDVMAAPEIAEQLRAEFGAGYRVSDWTVENASYFRAIRLEKMMMSILLSLIIGVAAFNIVAGLVMVVTDKTNDIAILRTLGMRPGDVVKVFFFQGAVIGWIGVFAGVLIGVLLAINVPTIAPVLESLFGFQIMPGDVYYVTRIPSQVEVQDVLLIGMLAFVLTSVATLYPARRAARVDPAVALRYE